MVRRRGPTGSRSTLSGALTTNEHSPGTDVAGSTVTFTLGSGSSAQSRTAMMNASGVASSDHRLGEREFRERADLHHFGGRSYYESSSTASTATVHTLTTPTVNAGTSDFADAGTVSAVLTNPSTGAGIVGEPATLDAELDAVLYRYHERQPCCVLLHHAERGRGDDPVTASSTATLRRRRNAVEPGKNNFIVTLEETAITDTGPSIAVSGTLFTMSAYLTPTT